MGGTGGISGLVGGLISGRVERRGSFAEAGAETQQDAKLGLVVALVQVRAEEPQSKAVMQAPYTGMASRWWEPLSKGIHGRPDVR